MVDRDKFSLAFQSCDKSQLSDEVSIILRLYLVDRCTEKEISQHFQISVSKTKQRIVKSVLELRKVCNGSEYLKAREILYGKPDFR
jgi:hypothetical protein